MDKKSFFKMSYGLFVAGVEYQGKHNACIINTASQATSEPPKMLATMLKTNLTTNLIFKKKSVNISVIGMDCSLETISRFGLSSGRDKNKFDNFAFKTDLNGNPYFEEGMIADFVCDVSDVIELSTHYVFILDVKDANVTGDASPMTYEDYRKIKSGGNKQNNSDKADNGRKTWTCSVCHYVYDSDTPFESLGDDYKCPVCGKGKEYFILG